MRVTLRRDGVRTGTGVALFVALALWACGGEFGPEPTGQPISGHVVYEGTGAQAYEAPVLLVIATVTAAEDVTPYALVTLRGADLAAPVPYELSFLEPYDYYVIATILDEADSSADPTSAPTGAYPNNCALLASPEGRPVTVTSDAPTTGINITVFDALEDDPCFDATPPTGTDVVVVVTATGLEPEAGDTLSVSLFASFPPVPPPAALATLEPPESFPATLTLEDVEEGEYYLIVCFDKGTDSDLCDGPGDRRAFYRDLQETLSVSGEQLELSMSLD